MSKNFEDRVIRLVEAVNVTLPLGTGLKVVYGYDYDFETTIYYEVVCTRPDADTGETIQGHGGKRFPHWHLTDGQIVRGIFAACLAYVEHELRETFFYKGKRVMGPHITLEALCEVADRVEY